MSEERNFDYAPALNAPYWIQELKTPKGVVLWTFSMPMEVSFFVVYLLSLIVVSRFWAVISIFGTLKFIILFGLPYWFAKKYVSFKPDGKKTLQYLVDVIRYMIDFGFNKKVIYQGVLVDKEDDVLVFEKTKLQP